MILGRKSIKYGLQPNVSSKKPGAKPIAAFADDDSDDEGNAVERDIAAQAQKKAADKKVAAMQAAALNEDPSIFDYDGVYDSIQEARTQPKQQEKLVRESRYIARLKDKAVERKREQDIRYERVLAKERDAEDHLFGDKERFVTAAYRQKLEEDKLWQAEEKKRQAKEAAEDVVKQGHMGNFYKNLLSNNVAFGTAKSKPSATRPSTSANAQQPAEGRAEAARPAGNPQAAEHDALARTTPSPSPSPADALPDGETRGTVPAHHNDQPPMGRDQKRKEHVTSQRPTAAPQRPAQPGTEDADGQEGPGTGAGQGPVPQDDSTAKAAAVKAGERRNDEAKIAAAKERYLARKRKAMEGGM